MAKKIVSIEIGVWWTKVLVMEDAKKNPTIYNAFYFDTPEHSVEDGFVRDKEVYLTALKAELAKRHILEKNVVFVLNSSKLVTREVSIPFVKDSQIAGIVEMQAKEFFPMNLVNYTISYKKMDEYVDEESKKIKLLLVAVPDSLLENYQEIAEAVNMNIRNYEYAGNSALQMICQNFMYNSIVIQLEENTTIVSMISDKKLVFQRVTPYGYVNALTSVIDSRVLGVEDDRTAFNFLETHDVLHMRAKVSEFREIAGFEDTEVLQAKLDNAYNDIKEVFNYYVRIVSTAMEYFQNQIKGEFRGRIHVIGDGARFAGVRKFFDDRFPLEAEKSDYSEALRFDKNIVLRDLPRGYGYGMMSVAGVVLDPISIMPKGLKEMEGKKAAIRNYFLLLLGAVVVSLGMCGFGLLKEAQAKTRKAELEVQRDGLSYIRNIYNENTQAKKEADYYINYDAATRLNMEDLSKLLTDLEEHFPECVTIQGLNISETTISFNAVSDCKLTVSELLLSMQDISYLSNYSIPSLKENQQEGSDPVWTYSVTASINRYEPAEDENQEN